MSLLQSSMLNNITIRAMSYEGYHHNIFSSHIVSSARRILLLTPGRHSVSAYHSLNPRPPDGVGLPSARRSTQRRAGRAGVSGSGGKTLPSLSFQAGNSTSSGAWKMTSCPALLDRASGIEVVGSVAGGLASQIHLVSSPVATAT